MKLVDDTGFVRPDLQLVVVLRGGPDASEKALRLAVLESACHDLQKPETPQHYDDAIAWIKGCGNGIHFEGVCFYLGLDPGATRKQLLDLAREHKVKSRLRGRLTGRCIGKVAAA